MGEKVVMLNKIKKTSIHQYQFKALKMIEDYINSSSKFPALVKMPTGTGKTGVMAVASQITKDVVLIIVPNSILPEQTLSEIQEGFFKKINHKPSRIKEAIIIDKASMMSKLDYEKNPILIMTIQLLAYIAENEEVYWKSLKDNVKLLFFDEGHREPAKYWRIVIRQFECKKILFTATPYRNDKTIFDVDDNFVYQYFTSDAIKDKSIVEPGFKEIDAKFFENDKLLATFISDQIKNTNHKVLVRMKDSERIKRVVNILNSAERCAVGFHSNFSRESNFFDKGEKIYDVKNDYQIFIHDEMFIEGLDFPELSTLILVDLFNNTKNYIQQIGRILRYFTGKKQATVCLPSQQAEFWKKQWELYLKFDSEDKEEIEYVDNIFKDELDIYSIATINEEDIRIPKRSYIYVSDTSYYNDIKQKIEDQISNRTDLEEWPTFENDSFWIIYYIKKISSQYLMHSYYENESLEFTCLYEIKSEDKYYLFYQDSSGFYIPIDNESLEKLPEKVFHKFLGAEADIRNFKTRTTLARKNGVNNRDMKGFQLGNVPQTLNDRLSYLTSVTAKSGKSKSYLSPMNSRISEAEFTTYKEYQRWCQENVCKIETDTYENPYFRRFSYEVEPLKQLPSSICVMLDVTIKDIESKAVEEIDSFYAEIDKTSGNFVIEVIGNQCTFSLEGIGTHFISAKSVDAKKYVICQEDDVISLIEYINNGNFTLFYTDKQIAYSAGRYYITNVQTRHIQAESWDMWRNIVALSAMGACEDEKTKGLNDPKDYHSWPEKSVFRVICDEINKNYKEEIDYLICDDMQSEIADFIGLSTKNRKIFFIHCKYKDNLLSASAFEDVLGQASKNSHYLFMTGAEQLPYLDKRKKKWEKKWKSKGILKSRLVKSPKGKTIKDFIEELKVLLGDYNTEREVWIATAGLSKKALKQEIEKDSSKVQAEEFIQLMWFIQNIEDTFSGIGVKLKIFCKE